MSDFLSQDDIDALLAGEASGDLDLSSDDSSNSSGADANITEIVTDYNEQQKTNLNTLIGKDVECVIDTETLLDTETVSQNIGDEYVILKQTFSGAASGVLSVVASKAALGILADLMVMGDGSAPYNEESGDAVKEMYSTVAGSYATFLGGKCEGSVSSEGVEVLENSGADSLSAQEGALLTITITDFDPFPAIVTLDDDLKSSLAGAYAPPPADDSNTLMSDGLLSQDEIDSITSAADDLHSINAAPEPSAPAPAVASNSFSAQAPKVNVDMLLDIDLDVSIELGKTEISIKRVLELAPGSLVELDRLAGEPVDLLVNSKVVAKGEVVVVDENFGVRIISLVSPEERIRSLR